jgi:hypothetical protein
VFQQPSLGKIEPLALLLCNALRQVFRRRKTLLRCTVWAKIALAIALAGNDCDSAGKGAGLANAASLDHWKIEGIKFSRVHSFCSLLQ